MQLTCVFCKMLRVILLRVFIILIFLRDCSFSYKRILTLVKTGFVSGSLTGFFMVNRILLEFTIKVLSRLSTNFVVESSSCSYGSNFVIIVSLLLIKRGCIQQITACPIHIEPFYELCVLIKMGCCSALRGSCCSAWRHCPSRCINWLSTKLFNRHIKTAKQRTTIHQYSD